MRAGYARLPPRKQNHHGFMTETRYKSVVRKIQLLLWLILEIALVAGLYQIFKHP